MTVTIWPREIKSDDFSFLIINFPFIGSDIRAAPVLWILHFTTRALCYGLLPIEWCSGQNSAADVNVTQTRLRCSFVNGIASKIIWSSSRTGFSLRNINFSNSNKYFPLCRYFLSSITDKRFWLPLWYLQTLLSRTSPKHCGFHIRSTNCLPFAISWFRPRLFGGVRAAHLFCLCCLWIVYFWLLLRFSLTLIYLWRKWEF